MYEVKVSCPNCGQHIAGTQEFFGSSVRCPSCQKSFIFHEDKKSCPDCGATISDGNARFCAGCGAKLSVTDEPLSPIPPVPSAIAMPLSTNAKPPEGTVEDVPKKRKWGWGYWLLVGAIVSVINRLYPGYERHLGLLELVGVGTALLVYFLLREKLLKRLIGKVWVRSLASGVVSYCICFLPVVLLAEKIASSVEASLIHQIKSVEMDLGNVLRDMKAVNLSLWSGYVQSPSTAMEVSNNVALIHAAVASSDAGFQSYIRSVRQCKATVDSSCMSCPAVKKKFGHWSQQFEVMDSMVNRIKQANRLVLFALVDYNQALLGDEATVNMKWEAVEAAQKDAAAALQEFALERQRLAQSISPKP